MFFWNCCLRAGVPYWCLRAAKGGALAESIFALAVHESLLVGGTLFSLLDPAVCVGHTVSCAHQQSHISLWALTVALAVSQLYVQYHSSSAAQYMKVSSWTGLFFGPPSWSCEHVQYRMSMLALTVASAVSHMYVQYHSSRAVSPSYVLNRSSLHRCICFGRASIPL